MSEDINPYEASAEDVPVAEFADPSSVIEIEGAISIKEARKAARILQFRHPAVWFFIGSIVLATVCFAIMAIQDLGRRGRLSEFSFVGCTMLLFLATIFAFRFWRIERMFWSGQGLCQRHRRVIDDSGVASESPTASVQQKWSAFASVYHSGDVVLLHAADSSRMAVVFGRSMFESGEQWQQFIELANKKIGGDAHQHSGA